MVTALIIISCIAGILLVVSVLFFVIISRQGKKCDELEAALAKVPEQHQQTPLTIDMLKEAARENGYVVNEDPSQDWFYIMVGNMPVYMRLDGAFVEMFYSGLVNPQEFNIEILKKVCSEDMTSMSMGNVYFDEDKCEVRHYLTSLQLTGEHMKVAFQPLIQIMGSQVNAVHEYYEQRLKNKEAERKTAGRTFQN